MTYFLLLTSNAVSLRRDKSYISILAYRRIQLTFFSVCLKTFKSSDPPLDYIAVVDLKAEHGSAFVSKNVVPLVPASENKITVVPVKYYSNTDTMKLYILKDNKAKAGIYR